VYAALAVLGGYAASNAGSQSMKVTVNTDMCEGHAKCEKAAPEVFKVGEDDVSVVLVDEVAPDDIEKVDRAIRLCPRQAISWTQK
jgi:ferredoxin